ncbi:2-chlorobenzoate 1,2-dioxygenase, alpha subunit [Klebsiella pneumoniae]|uniref:2-chlorobenzoate 1,2-dioxygenase, alpha subunit n=1 Tax=Klebsiella pneumoniae TaxID=573 RepID=A0A2X3GX89_KLEPN|nr:2-chlorobenzoate 1,2-dioxygenase, alpha subunit [Klebsiella pneumoniae]
MRATGNWARKTAPMAITSAWSTGTTPQPCHAATMKRKGRTRWMPTVGQKASAAAMDLITAICCCGPGRSTRKCARSMPPRTAAGGIWRTPCRPDGQRNPQPVPVPNVYLMDQFSTQIRVIRPIAVDKTEVTIWCFAPKGESDQARALRIRQYEDFFNVSGMGRRTTSKSSAPVSAAISAKICHGATSAAARCAGSMARMSMRNMPAFRRG